MGGSDLGYKRQWCMLDVLMNMLIKGVSTKAIRELQQGGRRKVGAKVMWDTRQYIGLQRNVSIEGLTEKMTEEF